MLSSDIRSRFLSFFSRQNHTIVRSSPLVPSDPTLLFTNAGMVQFKDFFTGRQVPDTRRAVTVQKCVRAGGKHNDLDNVGRTARHHTFFEMLGNFSFGDYFKAEAISFAWDFLFKELQLPKERLWFTVFAGEDGIPADDEARRLWQHIAGVSADRVIGLGKKDNFWMMGDTGPQGPCSEIHFHQGQDLPCALEQQGARCLGPACDCDRFLEIWNLVFMQFEKQRPSDPLSPLPAPSIDTGAGLERLTSVLQGRRSNYDTDLFAPLIASVAAWAKKDYHASDREEDVSMRVLADHARATAFLIADGVLPSNVARGYVLRSIMRRAIRHAVRLALPLGTFEKLCLQVASSMQDNYPELSPACPLIEKAVHAEDEGFRQTIDRGLRLLADNKQWQVQAGQRVLPGEVAFQLHDTYGFPLDLTQNIGREQGFVVDEQGYSAEMERQRSRSKFTGTGDVISSAVYQQIRDEVGPTAFVGYDLAENISVHTSVLALLSPAGERVQQVQPGQEAELFVQKTSFYGRSGGQVGDTGRIVWIELPSEQPGFLQVLDTWKPAADLIAHRARVEQGTIRVGQQVQLEVDVARREAIKKNHSATHLLHHVLRNLLGSHVTQKGSYVGPDKLTFDFSHFSPLTLEQLENIEQEVNRAVVQDHQQHSEQTSFDRAQQAGVLALFGEKYGDVVRVMRLGPSAELCGGTHVQSTGQIGLFKILSESGVAKGVRRIEAKTAVAALEDVQREHRSLVQLAALFKVDLTAVPSRVEKLVEDLKGKEKELEALRYKLAQQGASDLFRREEDIAGLRVVVNQAPQADPKLLRELAESLRDRQQAAVVLVGGQSDGKVAFVVAVHKDVARNPKLHAARFVELLSPEIAGRGGGRPDVAQAGGTDPSGLSRVFARVFDLVRTSVE